MEGKVVMELLTVTELELLRHMEEEEEGVQITTQMLLVDVLLLILQEV